MQALNSRFIMAACLLLQGAVIPCSSANEVELLFDGARVEAWDVARDAERLKREFSLSEVKAATNPPALI